MYFDFPLEIALIDDEPDMVELMGIAVASFAELTPLGFTDSRLAWQTIQERQVRLVWTDLLMPGMNGLDIIRACRECPWSMDIIVMTGMTNMQEAYECFDSGAWEVLVKPLDLQSISASLRRLVSHYQTWHATCDRLGVAASQAAS